MRSLSGFGRAIIPTLPIVCTAALLLTWCTTVPVWAAEAIGPLRVHPTNPRYFTDRSVKVVYLTELHHGDNVTCPYDGPALLYLTASEPALTSTELVTRLTPQPQQFDRRDGYFALRGASVTIAAPAGPEHAACRTLLDEALRSVGATPQPRQTGRRERLRLHARRRVRGAATPDPRTCGGGLRAGRRPRRHYGRRPRRPRACFTQRRPCGN